MKTFDPEILKPVHELISKAQAAADEGDLSSASSMSKVNSQIYNTNMLVRLGNGSFAYVYDLGDYVLKIGVYLESDGYPDFVDYIKEHPEYQDIMPNIVLHEEYPDLDGFITVMPKLIDIGGYGTGTNFMYGLIMDIYDEDYIENINMRTIRREIRRHVSRMRRREDKDMTSVVRSHVNLFRVIHEAAIKAPQRGFVLDLHSGNFMVDPETNKLLIIDPWCY